MPQSFSRWRLAAAVVIAFAFGLLFASGFDLTRFGFAQDGSRGGKVSSSQVQSLAETGNAFEAIADHVTPSVVAIQTTRLPSARPRGGRPDIEEFFRNFQPEPQQRAPQEASGTGFIVSKDGYILTNNHVVADADKVSVTLSDKRVFDAKVVGRDPSTDVAVIKIDGDDLPVAALGDDNNARVGQWVVAIGNPLGLDFTVTAGIISAKGRPLHGLLNNNYEITDYIQTDAAINPGNSGGPLVNIRGEVIGINSAIASSTGFYAGYGFAIPVTLAKQVMDDLIKYGKIRRAVMGVSITDATAVDAKAAGMKQVTGVYVRSFNPEEGFSPAREAGLQPGDVIVAADGQPTDRVSKLQRIVRGHKPGETVSLDVMRFGEKKTFKVKLIEAEDTKQLASAEGGDDSKLEPAAATDSRKFDKLGITVESVPPALVARARVAQQYRNGLMVSEVNALGPSYGKLRADNTILVRVLNPGPRRELRNATDLENVLSGMKHGDVVTFLAYEISRGPTDQGTAHAVAVEVE
jgi:serine protease Do